MAIRFFYMVAAHNEAAILEDCCLRLEDVMRRFPGSKALLLDNGSTDGTWQVIQKLKMRFPEWIEGYHDDEKGIGVAFRRGLKEISQHEAGDSDWVVFCAADLPFGFTDIDQIVSLQEAERKDTVLFVGSKAHPKSSVKRSLKRQVGSWVFSHIRQLILGLKTKDPHGSLILRGDLVQKFSDFQSNDYFFAIEVVELAEHLGRVREVPIVLPPEKRPSKVSLISDGFKVTRQLLRYKRKRLV